MAVNDRLLLGSSLASALGGAAAAALGATGWPANDGAAPTAVAGVLILAGFIGVLVGVFGLLVWFAGAGPLPYVRYLDAADRHAERGEAEYARTYYEEALRWGADPEDVAHKLALCEAVSARAATHRERVNRDVL